MHLSQKEIKKVILNSGVVGSEDYEKAVKDAGRFGLKIENVLIGNNLITEQYLTEILSEYLKIPIAKFLSEEISLNDMELLTEVESKKMQAVVFGREKGFLLVAMVDPLDLRAVEYIRAKTKMPVKVYFTGLTNLKEIWKKYQKDIGKEFHQIIKENVSRAKAEKGNAAKIAQDFPVISILDTMLSYAVAHNSSDIHIEIFESKVIVRYRIDGLLHDVIDLPLVIHPALIARIKILANLAIDEHRIPQDGRFRFKSEDQNISIRVSIMPTFYGEKAVLRILAGSSRPLNLSDLGLSEKHMEIVKNNISKTQGLILVTGPTGSGKTTTLYTILHLLNKPEVNICTIEDPIEYDITRINQTQVNPKTGITFAEGLRSFLRQNPNIIMVGEIRDKETLEMAIHASLTGHLVLATLHTNDAALSIPRLIDMGAEPFLLASTLSMVIAQRLVRKSCMSCLASKKLRKETMQIIKRQLKFNPYSKFDIKVLDTAYHSKGCKLCTQTGYHGQIGIYEVLEVTSVIKDLIIKNPGGDAIKKQAAKDGMVFLFEDGLEKVQRGETTVSEVLRVIRE